MNVRHGDDSASAAIVGIFQAQKIVMRLVDIATVAHLARHFVQVQTTVRKGLDSPEVDATKLPKGGHVFQQGYGNDIGMVIYLGCPSLLIVQYVTFISNNGFTPTLFTMNQQGNQV